jgi:hypothetical protein
MGRYIDAVMLQSDRIDERSRLIARLAELVDPFVDDLTRDPDVRVTVQRRAVLAAVRGNHASPLDLVAATLDDVARRLDAPPLVRLPDLRPGAALVAGLTDGRGVHAADVAHVLEIDPDAVIRARDEARVALHLSPVIAGCPRERFGLRGHTMSCPDCLLAASDRAAARRRLVELDAVPVGALADLIVARAQRHATGPVIDLTALEGDVPEIWTALVGTGA